MTFGPHFADCKSCEFNTRCNGPNQLHGLGRAPKRWREGGLMVVLEAPSVRELSAKQPCGPDYDFLTSMMRSVGVDIDTVWVAYAILSAPVGGGDKGGIHDNFPNAIRACLPRLEAEIKHARPRVVMTLGNAALAAVLGEEVAETKRVRFDCAACPEDRKIGPVFSCALGDCDWHVWPPTVDAATDPEWRKQIIASYGGKCPKCESSIAKVKPKRVKCFACGGKKMREEERVHLECDYKLIGRNGISGAVMDPAEHQSRLDDYGVRYVIPTYTAWFCRMKAPQRSSEYMVGGQFAARVMAEHVRKAHSLLTRDADYSVDVLTTEGMTPEQAAARIREYCAEGGRYSVDIEANTWDGVWAEGYGITCVGLNRYDYMDSLVVDVRACGDATNLGHPVVEALAEVMEREDITKMFVNRLYDEAAMRVVWGIEILGPVEDLMVAHINCYPDEEHGLGFMAHELTDAPAWKGGKKKSPEGTRDALSGYKSFGELALYNARDTRSTSEIDVVLLGRDGKRGGRIDEEGVRQVYDSDMRQQKVALEMQMVGMPVGLDALAALQKTGEKHCDHHLTAMRAIVANPEFVPTGGQLLDALFDPQGFVRMPVTKEGASGKPSADQGVLLKHVDKPFVQHLLAWRKHDYALSHYINSPAMKPRADGRWHPIWKPHGARTGRWTSEPNFQNWPKYIRTACVAGPGRKLVGYDYDQLELRGIGWVSRDERLVSMILEADESDKLNPACDLHSYNAARAFGHVFTDLDRFDKSHRNVEPGEDPCICQKCQRKALREVGKVIIYSVNYGSGAETVHENIYNKGYEGPPVTVQMVKAVMNTIFTEFPGLVQYRADTLRRAQEEGEIRSPLLFRHRIFPLGDIDVTVAYNYPIQSLGADIVNRQVWILYCALLERYPTAHIIAQVHDSVIVECNDADAEGVARLIEQCMNTELPLEGSDIIIPFTGKAEIGQSWDRV